MEEKKKRKQFLASVVERFLSESEYKKFEESYAANRKSYRTARAVDAKDLAILADYQGGMKKIRELADKHGVTSSAVLTSLRIAALSKLQ